MGRKLVSLSDASENGSSDQCSMETLGCNRYPIFDLKGSSGDELMSTLNGLLPCDEWTNDQKENGSNPCIYLVAPPLTLGDIVIGPDCFLGPYRCTRTQTYRPHLTTEDFPPLDGSLVSLLWKMELSTYRVTCDKRMYVSTSL